ncbi:Ribosomal protein L9/RNase H1, N-terminal [Sesbania bispinosa]|nr:Ribosomal protein L9/RNase H1, N-terminal [Sesbania bispinosa]
MDRLGNEMVYMVVYMVFFGRMPGVYKSWTDCYAQVNEFKGTLYKSFASLDEAEAAWRDFCGQFSRPSAGLHTRAPQGEHMMKDEDVNGLSDGKPVVSMGRYVKSQEDARDDVAVMLMRRLEACSGRIEV